MRKFFGLLVFLGLLSLPMMAQDKVEVFGGYQYTHFDEDFGSINHANGWDGSVTYKFSKMIGVTGDVSGAYRSIGPVDAHLYTYTFGPVVSFNAGRVKPFVHALAGGANLGANAGGPSVSANGFAAMAGGGVDLKLDRHFALRLFQADWVYYHFSDAFGSSSDLSSGGTVKLATGVVVRF
jgi:hypothetical protein